MPSTSAARRASREASREQQPRAPLRCDAGDGDSARCTAVTSWPASTARAAATAESTPPDSAARTRIVTPLLTGGAGALDRRADDLYQRVDVGGSGAVAEGEPQ